MSSALEQTNTTTVADSASDPRAVASLVIMVMMIAAVFTCFGILALLSRRVERENEAAAIQTSHRIVLRQRIECVSVKRKSYLDQFLVVRSWKQQKDESTGPSAVVSVCTEDLSVEPLDDTLGCAICMLNYQEGELVCESNNVRCKHIYHHECMEAWLKEHASCPMCRETYVLSEV